MNKPCTIYLLNSYTNGTQLIIKLLLKIDDQPSKMTGIRVL